MERTLTAETTEKVGKEVKLAGWVDTKRDHGKMVFVDLRDRGGMVQVVGGSELSSLRPEDVVEIDGKVSERPEKLVNSKIPTGKVEVKASKVKVLAKAKDLPFPIDDEGNDIEESLRLKYRYLDLRRPRLQRNLKVRHQVIQKIRDFLSAQDFIEVETPTLSKATPEGARDFLVPSRLQPGEFYALPQSPQQYKQLLQVAGIERYFQIVRCFRDEDPRADRAYGEFTQLDLEMSFTTQEEILELTEELFIEVTEKVLKKKVFQKPFPRFTHEEAMKKFGADKFDLREKEDKDVLAFAWVVDFPLFEKTKDRKIAPSHHPFTAPKDKDIPLLDKDPMKAKSWQHDLVCNGLEVGGGSMRITDPDLQKKIFKILGHSQQEIEEKFRHLLEAFKYGVPPHGGIAPGIDRFLMAALGESSVRETVAFPASASGQVSVMDAPSKVAPELLRELGIEVAKKKKS
ncbi:aspartate--tRNA ligase [Candidatus Woesebacteria bacterium]|nr:aspartate--tRNA ligase [Candidatus Woesebacteria bacterium]|tara:strand:- start:1076 stop:2449 length:1374 start_codon:yes stop_codon:yes gene_type:complete